MKTKFNITGMTCSSCSSHIQRRVEKLDGVNKADVNLISESMIVDFEKSKIDEQQIIDAVVKDGYGASMGTASQTKVEKKENNNDLKDMKIRLILSFLFMIPHFYISMGHMIGLPIPSALHNPFTFAFTQLLLTLPVMYVNRKYFKIGFSRLLKGSPNMDSLIAVGAMAAFIHGVVIIYAIGINLYAGDIHMASMKAMDLYLETTSMILSLITLGKFFEERSKGKTKEAIKKLLDLSPKTATVIKDGKEIVVSIDDIMLGDIIAIKPGDSIPCDGRVISGNSYIDESAISGESVPVFKQEGSSVISATINGDGYFTFEATKVGENTTISQIIKLVEQASASKAPIAQLADKVSMIFVPVVMGIALLSSIIWLIAGYGISFSLSIGIAVLVISCPCALGLATPVAIMVGTGEGAKRGIMIKSGEALEIAHKIDTILLDKTGTITNGTPIVTDYKNLSNINDIELLSYAYSLEQKSTHPISKAVATYAILKGAKTIETNDFENITGMGIKSNINGKTYFIGNKKLVDNNNISFNDEINYEAKTVLYFFDESEVLAIFAVSDSVKENSKKAISEFKKQGITPIMLTGDNESVAKSIAKEVGIEEYHASLLPNEKQSYIEKYKKQGKTVAMVGDGINDAPALMLADVGIAIGAGSDIAIESGDIVLMKSDLMDAVTSVRLSKRVIKNIKENLFWAFFYNILGIPIAAGVFYTLLGWTLNPIFAAAAMSVSSLCVVTNALRLRNFK